IIIFILRPLTLLVYTNLHLNTNLHLLLVTNSSTTNIYTLSLHDALPILSTSFRKGCSFLYCAGVGNFSFFVGSLFTTSYALILRSEEHTSELQSRFDLVCRLLLEKKKKQCRLHCQL